VTGLHIACFVHESGEPFTVDIEAENKKRASQRTSFPLNGTFKGRPFLVSLEWLDELKHAGIRKILPLTPKNRIRLRQIQAAREHGFELVSAIHPSVIVLDGATIEPGVWVNAGSIVGYKAELEAGVLINTGVQIDHHNVLRSCSQVDPGAVMAGNVTLLECAHVHTGATIINRIEIGEDTVIGAGAVVIRNIPPRTVAVGVPARVIKQRPDSDLV
jgi:sugar O-acyltransferase (sialic acid O-acetyltransferase NeuD family)